MIKYEIISRELLIKPVGKDILHETCLTVSIEDEGAGCFIVVRDFLNSSKVTFDVEQWPILKSAIESQIELVTRLNKNEQQKTD